MTLAHTGNEAARGGRKKVLAAFPLLAISSLERILGGNGGFLPVHSLLHAKALLQSNAGGISLVVCGVHFASQAIAWPATVVGAE